MMDADIEAIMPIEAEPNLSTMPSDDLLDEYRDEIVRLCAGHGRVKVRVPLRSEIIRRMRLAEPPKFGGPHDTQGMYGEEAARRFVEEGR